MPEYDFDIEEFGVADEEGESWQECVDRRRREQRPAFDCALCGASHESRGCAVVCCSARFDAVTDGGSTDDEVREALEGSA